MAFECFATARYCGDNHTSFDLDLLPSYFTITSGTLSMLSALIVLGRWIQAKRRKQLSRTTLQQDIRTMWAVAELVVAVSYIFAGINFITNKRETSRCDTFETIYKTQCFVTTWFSMSGNIWTAILMVDLSRIVFDRTGYCINSVFMPIYNIIAWIGPLTIAMPLLGTGQLECIGNRPIMHHPTAVSNFSLVISGPLWVLVTLAVVVAFGIIFIVHLGRLSVGRLRRRWFYLFLRDFLPLIILFIFLRLWGIVQTFVSILTPSDSNGGCIPWDTYTWHLVLEILVGVGEGGQGLVLCTFFLPKFLKWFKEKVHEWRNKTHLSSVFYFPLRSESETPSEVLVIPHSIFTTDTEQYKTDYPLRTRPSRPNLASRPNIASELPTDISLLSDIDVGNYSDEASHNALLSVVYMYMKFDALKKKALDKFVALSPSDFQQFLVNLTINCELEKHIHFFDTAVVFSCETLTDLFGYLDCFWDYINYDLLDCIIRVFGDDELKKDMDTYRTQLAEVQSVTTLQQLNLLMQSHPDLEIVRPHGVFVVVAVRLEAEWDSYTLLDAERLRQTFISTYSLTPYSIAFSSAEEGTIVLKLWLRSQCAPMIFHCKSQPIVDSRHSRILQITVDGIPYQFLQSQVATVEVHATDTPHPGYERSPISDPTTASPQEVDVITIEQVDSSPLDDTHLHDLMCETTNVTLEWYHMGLALGLLPCTLDAIQAQSGDLVTCRRTMLVEWLRQKDQVLQKGRPSWKTLVKALRSPPVNRADVANDIARKHKEAVIDLT